MRRTIRHNYSDDVNALKDYIIQFWDILSPRRPKLCLSILTSQYKSRISEDRKLRIIEEVLAALKSTDAWLINNGLNVTFNVLLGQELSKVSTNYFGDDTEFTPPKTIGVCPWGSICGRNRLMNNNNRINYVEYNVNSENEEPTTHPLLPFNSHLIFVDDGYRRDEVSVAKTGFRAKFEKMISEPAKKNVLNVPLVDLVIGGDLMTLQEAASAIENDICVLVFKGSGFAADIIAHAHELKKQLKNPKLGKFPDQQRQSIERAALTIVKTDSVQDVVPLVEKIISKTALLGIYNLEEDKPLSSELMRLIMFHATDTLGKLYLSLSWRKIDLAEELVLQNHADIKAKSLYGLLMTALLNNQLDFVKLLLKLGVDLQDFLTVDRLHCLYNFARNRGSFVSCLRNSDLDRRFVKEPLPPEEEWIIQESQKYSLHCEGSDTLRAAFTAFLGHFVDKKVQSYVDTLCKEEETRLTRVSKTTVYLCTVSEFLGPDFNLKLYDDDTPKHFSRTEMCEIRFREPADHLTIWAAMHARLEMATFFLNLSSHPLCLAIFGAALFRKMSSRVPAYDTKNIDMYEAFAQEFEDIAVEMVGVCEEQDADMTTAMLLEYKPSWETDSTPVAAANSDCLNFVSSSPFQNMVSLTWENGVNFSFMRLLLVLICPFLLFSKHFQVSKPLHARLDEMRASVPTQFLEGDLEPTAPKPVDLDAFCTKVRIFYRSPRTKFAFNFIALIVFLAILSYTLLFELYSTRLSYCEIIVMVYSVGWIVETLYTCIGGTGTHRTRFGSLFSTFPWIPLYFVADLVFIIAACCRINMERDFLYARYAYSLLLILSSAKLLNFMMLSRYYGPLVVMINKMWVQLLNAAIILFIIMIAYGAAVQVLLFPQFKEYDWDLIFNIFYYPYFQLFGEMSFEFFHAEGNCNETVEECPRHSPVVPVLHAAYMLIAVLIFLNLLIAVFSKVFSDLVEQSRNIWMQNRFRVVFYFDRIGIMPAPFSTLQVIVSLLKKLFRSCARCCRKTPTPLPEAIETETATGEMAKPGTPNNLRNIWRRYVSYYMQMEYGMQAYLHRFQEYSGNLYYKTVERNAASSFDAQLNSIMRRLDELQRKHDHFVHYLPGMKKVQGQQRKTIEEEYIRLTAPQRLKALKSQILKAIDRVAKLTKEASG
uniref:Transient receptor potential cation channel subfamily M member 3 n=1 Tax=Schistocephalus solidus TaxID=70667 RepID=A0A0X3NXF5_SCHSO